MSAYTTTMEAAMTAQGSFTYEQATKFANDNGLSVRSVISKIKSLGLDYERKPVTKSVGKPETKAEIVASIASFLTAFDRLEGLEKADKQALLNLRDALGV